MKKLIHGLVFLSALQHIHAQSTTPLSLEYKPTRPFYAPKPIRYPEPIIRNTSTTTTIITPIPVVQQSQNANNNVENRVNVPVIQTQSPSKVPDNNNNTPVVLGYKPMKPFYLATVPYPQPHPWYTRSTALTTTPEEFKGETEGTTLLAMVTQPADKNPNLEQSTQKLTSAGITQHSEVTMLPSRIKEPSETDPNSTSLEQAMQQLTSFIKDVPKELLSQKGSTAPGEKNENVTPMILSYKPSRPPYAPNPVQYPQPVTKSEFTSTTREIIVTSGILTSKAGKPVAGSNVVGVSEVSDTTPVSLENKPSRPPFVPNPVQYPQPVSQVEDVNTDSNFGILSDTTPISRPSFGPYPVQHPQPVEGQNSGLLSDTTPISLEYKPSRPPFAPNPIQYSQLDTQTGDGNMHSSSVGGSKPEILSDTIPLSLDYKPTRPPFAPNPVQYPQPTTQEQPLPSTVPSLEYQPSRPPYAPNPIHYPQPISRNNSTSSIVSNLKDISNPTQHFQSVKPLTSSAIVTENITIIFPQHPPQETTSSTTQNPIIFPQNSPSSPIIYPQSEIVPFTVQNPIMLSQNIVSQKESSTNSMPSILSENQSSNPTFISNPQTSSQNVPIRQPIPLEYSQTTIKEISSTLPHDTAMPFHNNPSQSSPHPLESIKFTSTSMQGEPTSSIPLENKPLISTFDPQFLPDITHLMSPVANEDSSSSSQDSSSSSSSETVEHSTPSSDWDQNHPPNFQYFSTFDKNLSSEESEDSSSESLEIYSPVLHSIHLDKDFSTAEQLLAIKNNSHELQNKKVENIQQSSLLDTQHELQNKNNLRDYEKTKTRLFVNPFLKNLNQNRRDEATSITNTEPINLVVAPTN